MNKNLITPEFLEQVYKNCKNVEFYGSKTGADCDFYAVENIEISLTLFEPEPNLPSSLSLNFKIKHFDGQKSEFTLNAPTSHAEPIRKLAKKLGVKPVKAL